MRTHRSDAYFCIRTGRLTLIACPPSHPASAPTGPEPESTPVPSAEPEAFQVEPAPGPARDRLAPPPAPPAPPAPPSAPQPVPAAPIPQPTSPVSAPRRRRLGRGGRAAIGTVLVLVLVLTGAVTWMVIRSRSSETHKTPPSLQAILDLSNLGGNLTPAPIDSKGSALLASDKLRMMRVVSDGRESMIAADISTMEIGRASCRERV